MLEYEDLIRDIVKCHFYEETYEKILCNTLRNNEWAMMLNILMNEVAFAFNEYLKLKEEADKLTRIFMRQNWQKDVFNREIYGSILYLINIDKDNYGKIWQEPYINEHCIFDIKEFKLILENFCKNEPIRNIMFEAIREQLKYFKKRYMGTSFEEKVLSVKIAHIHVEKIDEIVVRLNDCIIYPLFIKFLNGNQFLVKKKVKIEPKWVEKISVKTQSETLKEIENAFSNLRRSNEENKRFNEWQKKVLNEEFFDEKSRKICTTRNFENFVFVDYSN
ncbi:unnamed protein product, partial [Brachionus calyciflorus]